nr:MAG TPA: hypothetical protein [Caudoviricetes sp.]
MTGQSIKDRGAIVPPPLTALYPTPVLGIFLAENKRRM